MPENQVTISLPASSAALAQGIQKLFLAVVAAHKAGGGVVTEVGADVTAAITDLGPILGVIGAIPGEFKADGGGVAEAFALAGFEAERALKAQAAPKA